MFAFVLLGQYVCAAHGQFTGPSLGASSAVNQQIEPTKDRSILYPPPRPIQLMQGDLLSVHIFQVQDYTPIVRVSVDGTIRLPLAGVLHVDGLSLQDAETKIAKRLMDLGMYRDPQVTIEITESPSQIVTVTGEMHFVEPLFGEKRLYDVLAAAGGLPPAASHTITINRPGIPEPIIIDLGTNPAKSELADVPIFPRDTIVVSRVGVVYLLGAFKLQGPIPLQQNSPLTLMQAAAIGGGVGFEAQKNDLRIIRTVGLERKVVKVDLKRVFNGKDPDPILQTDDIVLLPTNAMKAAIKGGGLGTLQGIASTSVYALKY